MTTSPAPVFESDVPGLELLCRGKVRDVYAIDDRHLLMVASDRLSAFDVVLPDPIPGKGAVLTALSNFWFARTADRVRNHLSGLDVAAVVSDPQARAALAGRAMVVQRLDALPVEAIVRGYVIGSGWKEYQRAASICGIELPVGLQQAERLPQPIFTPSTKAELGDHDENVDFARVCSLIGTATAERVRELSLEIYCEAAAHAAGRGIIIADTKFEFGLDASGDVVLIDEVLTPDSSRFWPADSYATGISPPSFDKQFVRDYLETLDWDKRPPAPKLPAEVVERTAAKYREAERRLTR